MRLLLVEDDDVLAAGVLALLEDEGHEVERADRGRPVIGLIQRLNPDAIVLDVTLPDIDGIQVSKFIRLDYPDLPIVFATGHDRDQTRLRNAVTDNRMAILRKPYEIETLLNLLSRLRRVLV